MALPEKEEKTGKILILCVDRDGDLGAKAGITTPILGRDENVKAAVELALKDPEEPDANAMFEAVRVHDRLREEGKPHEDFQIATISGSDLGGVGADRKLVAELTEVLKTFPAKEVILVTDGYADEAVLPLVESRVPVTSVRRIVVKHSESIEETWALFRRYLKMIMENPRYSRIALGLPGLLILVLGILSVFNLITYYLMAFLIVLGSFLFIKGFGIDRAVKNFYHWVREYSPPPLPVQVANFSAIAGAVAVVIGCYLGWNNAAANLIIIPNNIGEWLAQLPKLIGWFMSGSIVLVVVGVCVLLTGRAIRWYFERDPKVLRTIVIVVVIAWSWRIFDEAAQILVKPIASYEGFIFAIVVGVLLAMAAVLVTFVIHRIYGDFFAEKEKQVEEIHEG